MKFTQIKTNGRAQRKGKVAEKDQRIIIKQKLYCFNEYLKVNKYQIKLIFEVIQQTTFLH